MLILIETFEAWCSFLSEIFHYQTDKFKPLWLHVMKNYEQNWILVHKLCVLCSWDTVKYLRRSRGEHWQGEDNRPTAYLHSRPHTEQNRCYTNYFLLAPISWNRNLKSMQAMNIWRYSKSSLISPLPLIIKSNTWHHLRKLDLENGQY